MFILSIKVLLFEYIFKTIKKVDDQRIQEDMELLYRIKAVENKFDSIDFNN
jgi:hypothetical protein